MEFKKLCKYGLIGIFLILHSFSYAQTNVPEETEFTGRVLDAKKAPIPGVVIEIQEKDASTVTDRDGKFKITAALSDVMVLKMAGYLTQQLTLSNRNELSITLQLALTDAEDDDDVVIPFGVRKKRQITAAVTSYKVTDLPHVPVTDLKNALSGRVSGLYLEQNSTQPGNDGTDLRMRGQTSYGNVNALALVDGVQREFGDMDPGELESITVLKDAATLAWYGLRAGSGVVLVTTKKGSANKSGINFDIQTGFQTPETTLKPLNSFEYATLVNEAITNDNLSNGGSVALRYSQADLNAYANNTDPERFPSNNYQDELIKNSSAVQRYVLSADGGTNAIRYFTLLSYFDQGGIFKNTQSDNFDSNVGFKKFNFRGNVDFKVSNSLDIGLNVGGRSENRLTPGDGLTSVLSNIYNLPPDAFPLTNPDGTYGGRSQFQTNPLAQLQKRGYVSTIDRVLLASLNVKQKMDFVTHGLSANVMYSYDVVGTYSGSGQTQDYEVYDLSGTAPVRFRTSSPLGYRNASFTNNNRRNDFWAGFDYDRNFGRHQLNASFRGQRFVNAQPERLDFRIQGLASRIDYAYNSKYYLSFVAGYSGSENFPESKRYGFFPAVSGGWILSDESFLKGNKTLSYLKLRASHGISGNSEIGAATRFPFQTFFTRAGGGGYPFGTGFTATNNANEVSLANPFITWETLRTTDLGMDFKLFNNRLSAAIDVYKNRRSNILTTAALPNLLGQSIGTINEGIVDSRGIESSMNYDAQIGKFNLSFNGNITLFDNKIINQNGQDGLPEYQKTFGFRAGSSLIYMTEGLFQSQADIDNPAIAKFAGTNKTLLGDVRYRDINKDGIIDGLDRVRVNNTDLNTFYGFGTSAKYKSFDMSVQFQGVAGRTVNIQSYITTGPSALNQESLKRFVPGTNSQTYPRLGLTTQGNNNQASDFWTRSGDFLRLKTVEIGFTVPPTLLSKYGLKSTRLYVGGFNLANWNKLGVDIDPEVLNSGRFDQYPYLKTYSFGLTTRF